MQNYTTIKTLVVLLTLWINSLAAEKNIILRALSATSNVNIRKTRDVSGPSILVTSKPSCPSFISCPYPPYPRPTTKRPTSTTKGVVDYFGSESHPMDEYSTTTSETENKSEQPEGGSELGNIQGPSISATTKPPCPGYITCPYPPYPRPTTKPPLVDNVASSLSTSPEKLIVEYIDPGKEDSEKSSSVSELDSHSDGSVAVNKSGNAQGPSISATSKPPCPSYISCPYPGYPRPTTKSPLEESVTEPSATTVPDKEIVDYIGPEKEDTSEKTPSVSEITLKPEVIDGVNKPGNAQGPSISATSKPPCPSYITCPYPPYPRPTTKPPQEESAAKPSTTTVPDKEIVDYIGPEKEDIPEKTPSVSETTSKPEVIDNVNKPGNAQGPSISATSKPPCPSYISCPYPGYPRPTTKSPQEESATKTSATTVPDKEIVDYIGPEKEDTSEKSPSVSEITLKPEVINGVNKPGNAQGPSISATSKPPCPSFITCPYPPYPRPTTKAPQEEGATKPSTTTVPDKLIVDYVSPDKEDTSDMTPSVSDTNPKPDTSYSLNRPGNAQGPSISATSKPPCPSYITCPYPSYPRPTTKRPFFDKIATSLHLISYDKTAIDNVEPDSTASPEDLQSIGEASPPTTATVDSADGASVSFESNAIVPVTLNDDSENKQSSPVTSETTSPENISSIKNLEVESIALGTEVSEQSFMTESPGKLYFPGLSNSNINNIPPSSDSISESQNSNLPEYQSDALYMSRGPAISATQRPRCSFYAPCPYEYPKPTTASPYLHNRISYTSTSHLNGVLSPSNNPLLHTNPSNVDPFFAGTGSPSPQDPVVLGNQGAFLPIYSYVYGIDPYAQNAYYYNRRPILLTQQPFWPSYVKNPWIYPRPVGGEYANDQDTDDSYSESSDNTSSDVEEEDQKGVNENSKVV
ncbi:hypothetical protein R5R35_006325 [Gryllus longicercus]|uniref:Uncharacterized protein n=1 Tax=Gryllus longicercus TaxID=2509291 RepID=A0AAN9VFJ8_9ORTH